MGIERIYPLTHLQEGILYHYISKETKQYVSQDVFLINQNINSNILADVFEYVLKKYPILRTRIIYEKLNVPVQIILSKCDNSFNSYINDIGYNDKLITEAKNKELKQIDNLVKNSLFNLCQVKFNDRDILIFTYHHIIIDGWSSRIVYDDFFSNLDAYITSGEIPQINIEDNKVTTFEDFVYKTKEKNSKILENNIISSE